MFRIELQRPTAENIRPTQSCVVFSHRNAKTKPIEIPTVTERDLVAIESSKVQLGDNDHSPGSSLRGHSRCSVVDHVVVILESQHLILILRQSQQLIVPLILMDRLLDLPQDLDTAPHAREHRCIRTREIPQFELYTAASPSSLFKITQR
jgi:hypothetical protein